MEFCAAAGLSPFPAREASFSAFVAFLYRLGLSARTVIKSYLSAVRHAQITLVLGDLGIATMPQLEYVTEGLCKKTAGKQKRTRDPCNPMQAEGHLRAHVMPLRYIDVVGSVMPLLFWVPQHV